MNLISSLRQFRIGGIAIFDLAVSYFGIYFLAPVLSKIFKKFGLLIGRKEWLWLTLPIGVMVHLLVGQETALNSMLLSDGNYLVKIILIFMLWMGLKEIKIIRIKK